MAAVGEADTLEILMRVVPALMEAGPYCATMVKEALRSGDDR
jgi:hypothetical protein